MAKYASQLAALTDLERQCLGMVSAGHPLATVLDTITTTIDDLLPALSSSILLVENDRLHRGSAPSLPAPFFDRIDGLSIGEGVGSCGTAAFRKEQVVVTDTLADPLWSQFRDIARQFGLRSCWTTPILSAQGDVLAVFSMYASRPGSPDELQQQIMERLSSFIRVAIVRGRTQYELRRTRRRFEMIVNHIEEAFWIADKDNEALEYISPAFEDIWGFSGDRLQTDPRAWLSSIHPEDRPRIRERINTITEAPYDEQYRIYRPDGELCWISDRGFPVTDDEGKVQNIVGVARDITTQKQAEFELQERIKELRCLYRVSTLLATSSTTALPELFDQITTLLPSGFQYPDHTVARLQLQGIYNAPPIDEPLHQLHIPIVTDGTTIGHIDVAYVEPIPDTDSDPKYGAFFSEEAEMLQAIATQIGHVLETRNLANQLSQKDRLNALGQLTGGVAHDFNNLLTVIISNAEYLRRKPETDGDTHQVVSEMLEAAQSGADLTGRLLAFARRRPLRRRLTDINTLIEQMEDLLVRTLGDHIDLDLDLDDELWPISTDTAQLESSILNLCINARDAMADGGLITLRTRNRHIPDHHDHNLEPGPHISLSVIDTGHGMDTEVIAQAFDPFFTTKETSRGSGLGLSMVHGYVNQCDGHITLDSVPGKGTQVQILLPVSEDSSPHPSKGPQTCDEIDHQGEGRTVLLVEDHAEVRANISRTLQSMDYNVVAATDGASALPLLEQRSDFNLLITDVLMPGGINGHQLANRARKLHPTLPVLLISGYDNTFNRDSDEHRHGAPILLKPFGQRELAHALTDLLDA